MTNSNIMLGWPNRVGSSTIFSAGSWVSTLPASNLATTEIAKVARSTSAALVNTKFTADLGALKPVRCVALANHNLSANATVLVKVKGESGNSNLLTYSEQFDNAAWSTFGTVVRTPNTHTAPDGTVTADSVTISAASGVYQTITTTPGQTYVVSCYIRGDSAQTVRFLSNTNLSEITLVTVNVTTSWQRVTIVKPTTTGVNVNLQFDTSSTGAAFQIWGAQLEVGSTASTYKPTTTAASNIALHYSSGWQPAWRMVFDNLVEWESATWWAGIAGDEYLRSPYAVSAIADDTYSARYVAVEISDTANADGYVQIGRLFVGGALQPTYNAAYGLQDQWRDLSSIEASESGAMWATERRKLRSTSFVLPYITPAETAYYHEMQRQMGTTREVLYLPYPSDMGESQRYGFLGRLSELSAIDYPYCNARSLPIKIEEIG